MPGLNPTLGRHLPIVAAISLLTACSHTAVTVDPSSDNAAVGAQIIDPTPLEGANSSIVREATGIFEYRKISSGKVTGGETFTLTVHSDGTRTIQARNRSDNYDLQRHVTHRVDQNFRPLETTAVYYILGEWRGTGFFAVNGDTLEAFVKSPEGMVRQTLKVPEHFSLVPHPLSTNAWHGWYYDRAKGGQQTSIWYNLEAGAQGESSMLGELSSNDLEFLGEEQLTTPAGTFSVDHWKTGTVDYYTTGPDALMVKFVWAATDNVYELVQLQTH